MPLVEYVPDPRRYEGIFTVQIGYGPMVRYRGSHAQYGAGLPQVLKGLFAKLLSLAKPIIKSASPHARAAFEAAKPHLKEAASTLVSEAGRGAVEAISRRFNSDANKSQEGSGRKVRRKTRKVKNHKRARIAPYNIPDYY